MSTLNHLEQKSDDLEKSQTKIINDLREQIKIIYAENTSDSRLSILARKMFKEYRKICIGKNDILGGMIGSQTDDNNSGISNNIYDSISLTDMARYHDNGMNLYAIIKRQAYKIQPKIKDSSKYPLILEQYQIQKRYRLTIIGSPSYHLFFINHINNKLSHQALIDGVGVFNE